MNEKKVIAVIVEGPSDENAIGGILKEFFFFRRGAICCSTWRYYIK